MESEPAREAEEEEIDVIWDENGAARYRILKDTRIVDFDGHNIAWLDEHGNIIDYEGRHRGFYVKGVIRDPEGMVVGLGQAPEGPHPDLDKERLRPGVTKATSATRRICRHQPGRDILPARNVLNRCGYGDVRTTRISHGEND